MKKISFPRILPAKLPSAKTRFTTIALLLGAWVCSVEALAQTTTNNADGSVTVTYSSSGTFSFLVPTGVTSLSVEAWGGGGAGGGRTTTGRAGGGAGGNYVIGTAAVTAGNSYSLVVGAIQLGGNGNGTTGNPSMFGGTTVASATIVADGGVGGTNAGTTVTAVTGNSKGGNVTLGGNGGASGTNSGAGGDGANAVGTGGAGRGTTGSGNNASSPGGGGGGGYRSTNGTANGGTGAPGQIVITYNQPLTLSSSTTNGTTTVTSSGVGNGTFTVPATGVKSFTVQVWGSGAGGGSSNNATGNGGGGGGGGAFAQYTYSGVTGGTTYNLTTSLGGVGGSANSTTAATDGGDIYFGNTTAGSNTGATALAKGGTHGINAGNGGAGGLTSGGIGDVTYAGGNGGNSGTNGGAGGGSSSGNTGNGANASNGSGSNGATVPTASGTGGNGGNGSTTGNGSDGSIPGGGGGGSQDDPSSNGGYGAVGQILITYTLPNVSNFSVAASSTICATNAATFTISSSTLQTGNYTVTYNVTGTSNSISSTTATVSFTSGSPGTATFTTATTLPTVETDVLNITQITDNATNNFVAVTSNTSFTVSNCRGWYSYKTGNFNDYHNWTLDPSGSTFLNGLSLTPGLNDNITILNGKTIAYNINNLTLNSATIQNGATLDMVATSGHNLGTITGTGTLRIKGIALPNGTYTDFVSINGGTVEYYDVGGTLPTTPTTTYNNLKLTNSGSSSTSAIFIEASDLTVNGAFTVGSTSATNTATWQINNASNVTRTVIIYGDLSVATGGRILVGTGNSGTAHSISMYGNFTNNGVVQFFDPTSAPFFGNSNSSTAVWTAGLTGKAADVTFLGSTNAVVTCNNQTDFYRFILDKGTGQQTMLTVNSSNTSNFRFFGPSNIATDETSPTTNSWEWISSNALSIVDGTLQLTGSINIPVLQMNLTSGTGYFPIPRNGALWLNGVNVTVQISDLTSDAYAGAKDGRILMSGLLRITAGTLFDGFSKGLGSQDGGTYWQEGGTVNCWQFRPRSTGTGVFSFIMTGGTMNVGYGYGPSGGKIDTYEEDYCRFDLSSPNSTFQMSGSAVLNVAKPTNPNGTPVLGGLFAVGSSSSNYSVTGGTVNLYMGYESAPANTYPGYVSSTAPLYNVNIYGESSPTTPQSVQLQATNSNATIQSNTLTVLNNLTINQAIGALTGTLTQNTPTTLSGMAGTFPRTYLNVSATGGTGTGAKFTVVVGAANSITSITAIGGSGYAAGNVLTFAGSLFGGTGSVTCNIATANIATAPTFDTNNLNVTVGGNFSIQNGTTFTPGTGTITFNGSGAQTWAYGNSPPSATFPSITSLGTVVVNKNAGTVSLSFPNTTFTTIPNTNVLPSIGTLTLTSGTFNDGGSKVTVTTALTNNAIHTSPATTGSITFSAVNGTIGGTNGTFGNLILSGNNSVTVMSGNQTVTGNLNLTGTASAAGPEILNIGSNNLTVGGNITSTAGFGNTSYILTSGLRNAGGLTRPATANTDVLFPVGVLVNNSTAVTTNTNRQYTPNTINVNSATTFGTITTRPVNNVHPNVTTSNASLAYYWRVISTGFTGLGTVTHKTYQFADGTGTAPARNGTQSAYVAARYDRSNNTWGYYIGAGTPAAPTTQTMATKILPDPLNTATTWTGVTGSQLDGEYTCGNFSAFGSVSTYYSITTGNWNTPATWSNVSNTATSSPASTTPCATCPVIIGNGVLPHVVTIPNGTGAAQMCGTLSINANATLDCGTNANAEGALGFGTNTTETSTGTLKIGLTTAAGTTGHFPSGDFTNFIGPAGGTVEYYGTNATGLTIPVTYNSPTSATQPLTTYYNLVISSFAAQTVTLPATSLTIYNNFTEGSASSYTGTVVTNVSQQTISVGGNFTVSYGTFTLSASGNTTANSAATTLNVSGNIVNNGTFSCATQGTNTRTNAHAITVYGNFTNAGTMNFRQFTSGTQYNVADITFGGSTSVNFGGAGSTTLDLVTINKGTSQSPTVTFNSSGALTTTAAAGGWLTLTNGTFDFEYTGTPTSTTVLTTSTYTIPNTTKLKIGQGTIQLGSTNTAGNDLFLSGTLEIGTSSGGNGTFYTFSPSAAGSNGIDIEYASAGTPTINILSGALLVDGAIRRSTSTITGSLVYNQSGGTVTVGGNNPNTTRGVFEIDANTGSSFKMTNSSILTVQRQTGGTGYADLYINPITSNVDATSTINIGLTTATQNNLRVDIVPTVGNFTVLGGNTQTVKLYDNLAAGGTLTITSPSVLDATQTNPNANVTIAGDFNCTGTYTGGTNTTTFNGSGAQSAGLTSNTQFYNVTINKSAGTVTVSGTAPAAPGLNNLNILSGILEVGNASNPLNNTLKVNRNITINGTQIGTQAIEVYSTSGISNTITSSGGTFTNLTLGGTVANATVSVSGNLTINGTLDLLNTTDGATNRYLNIASSQLTFGSAAPSPTNAGSTAFIRTNGVASDLGVVKSWTGNGAFLYAVGTSSNYTPVSYSLNVTSAGTLTVVPVNSAHNTAVTSGTTDDILNYYWTVTRSSSLVATPSSSFTFKCPSSLLSGSTGTLVPGYLDPNALASNGGWVTNVAGSTTGILSGTITLTFPSTPTTDFPSISPYFYDYSAGTTTTLPNPIKGVYSRKGTGIPPISAGGGNWSTGTNWTFRSDGDPTNAFPGSIYSNPFYGYPHGLPVTILSGTQINMDIDGLVAYKTTINGVLYNASTAGHNLGAIDGTGTFKTATSNLPAGTYTTFTSTAGGTIEYSAPVIMDGVTTNTYNYLKISSTGVVMTASNLTINSDLTITSGSSLDDSNSLAGQGGLAIAGNFLNSGTYTAGASTAISVTGNLTNSGTFNASSSTFNLTGNLQNTGTYNGGSGILNLTGNLQNTTGTFNGGSGTVNLIGNFSNSGTFSGGTGTVKFNGTAAQTITGATTFNNLTINNSFATLPQVTVASGNQTVGSTFTNTKGLLNLNSTTLTIGTACASSGAVSHSTLSSAGWVYGGNLTRYFNTTAISDGSLTGFFPIGTSVNFRPFAISVPAGDMSTCGTFTLSVGSPTTTTVVSISDPTNTVSPIVLQYQGAWTVSSSGVSGGTYNVTAGGSGFGTIGSLSDVTLSKATTTVGTYVLATANSISDPRMERTGLSLADITSNDGNQFFVGSTNAPRSPLPIELLSFTGDAKSYGVDLQWKTASEMNNDFFTVSRSATGAIFESIGTVEGNGTTNTPHSYALVDYKPLLGKNYYQLKQTDFDGHITTSETIVVDVLSLDPLVSIYPNPLSQNQVLNVVINGLAANSPTEIQIVNVQGIQVNGATLSTDADGSLNTSIVLTGLSAGLYILKIQNVHYKFVIE